MPRRASRGRPGGGGGGAAAVAKHGRPTHFVAVRLSRAAEALVGEVQGKLAEGYAPYTVDKRTAHVTLGVLSLVDDEAVDAAAMAMRTLRREAGSAPPELVVGEGAAAHAGTGRHDVTLAIVSLSS